MNKILLLTLCLLFVACRAPQAEVAPTIEFSKIPPAGEGGPDRVDSIGGRVTGARPGQKIILFTKSGTWYVQPFMNQPFTELRPDSTWENSTHLGTDYAALLVDADYRPPVKTDELPPVGDGVAAVATVPGAVSAEQSAKTISFSGYEWKLRTAPSDRGGALNNFDPQNVWTDEKGYLHLRIAGAPGRWTCAELSLTRSLGYGTYNLVVQDVSHLEPAAVVSMFTWDDREAGQNHREMNVEITRWGDPANKNLRYVIQPFYLPANVVQFSAPPGVLTHSMRWESGKVVFKTVAGAAFEPGSKAVAEHTFASRVPVPGDEKLHLIFYVFNYSKQPLANENEVVIEKFEYLP